MTEGLDTAIYVGSLNASEPTGQRKKSTLDNHDRTIKGSLLNSFAGFEGQIIVTGTEAQGATVNDYVLTVTANTAPTGYEDRMLAVVKFNHTNTSSAVTLAINSIASASVVGMRGEALGAGDLPSGYMGIFTYDDGSNVWRLVSTNDRVSRNGDTLTGTLAIIGALMLTGDLTVTGGGSFTSAVTVPTASAGDNSTKAATTEFVVEAVMGATVTIPGQTGKAGLQITTDGSSANWGVSAAEALALMPLGIV